MERRICIHGLAGLILLPQIIWAQASFQMVDVPTGGEQYERLEISVEIDGATYADPYDFRSVALDAFWVLNEDTTVVPGYFVEDEGERSIWSVRYAPVHTGQHEVRFRLQDVGGAVYSHVYSVQIDAGTSSGFLHNDPDGYMFWQFDSGERFRGVGGNFAWENQYFGDSLYTYPYLLEQYAQQKVNFIRTWMCPWNLPVAWKNPLGDLYTVSTAHINPSGAGRMDTLIELLERYDMYTMLTLDYHGALSVNPDSWGSNNFWYLHNYNKDNGGPCATPQEFFTLPEAKALYKNRLRYIIARWGYSTRIAAFEFWNEVDNLLDASKENWNDTMAVHITNWHKEMGEYLKEVDPYGHLITTSVTWYEVPGLMDVDALDFIQTHPYELMDDFDFIVDYFEEKYNKPYVIGEFAGSWNGPSADDQDLHRGLWYGLFLPTPVLPLTWWWDSYHPLGYDANFKYARIFSDRMLGEPLESIQSAAPGLEIYALEGEHHAFAYVRNNGQGLVSDSVELYFNQEGIFDVERYNTRTGEFTTITPVYAPGGVGKLAVSLLPQEDIAFVLKRSDQTSMLEYEEVEGLLQVYLAHNTVHFRDLKPTEIHVYDLNGQCVLDEVSAHGIASVQVGHLSPGMYCLTGLSPAGKVQTTKFIKPE